jgi:hypothetical protein
VLPCGHPRRHGGAPQGQRLAPSRALGGARDRGEARARRVRRVGGCSAMAGQRLDCAGDRRWASTDPYCAYWVSSLRSWRVTALSTRRREDAETDLRGAAAMIRP